MNFVNTTHEHYIHVEINDRLNWKWLPPFSSVYSVFLSAFQNTV